MNPQIKEIEDLSLNAWPSHQMQIYDGWILRFSYFYTHRTNCVEQIGASSLPIDEKIRYCEREYRRWGTPAVFKITPLLDPDFDLMLKNQHYVIQHSTDVMIRDLSDPLPDDSCHMHLHCSPVITDQWIQALFHLKNTTNVMHRTVVPSMYRAIPKDVAEVAVTDEENEIIGTGLGILDRDYIGIYAIHIDPSYRRQGLGCAVVSKLLREGRKRGAKYAYLQVVESNTGAFALYRTLGFLKFYNYWFRVRNII